MAVSPVIAHIQGEYGDGAGPRDIALFAPQCAWACGRWYCDAAAAAALFHPRHPAVFRRGPGLAADAARFISGLAWGLPFALAFQVLRSFSTALSRAVPPLIVMALAVLFNALGDYALIFGHFGLPRLGLLGAGMASASSNFFSFVVLLAFCLRRPSLQALSHPAPPDAAGLEDAGGTVSAGPAHGRHHGVRSGAVQRRDPGDGRLRHRLDRGASDRHHHSLAHLHGAAGHRPGSHGAGRHGGRRRRCRGGAARRFHRHRHSDDVHVHHRVAAAAVSARHRQPVAARHAGKCAEYWRWR